MITLNKLGSKIKIEQTGLQTIYKDHNDVEVNYYETDANVTDRVGIAVRNGQNIISVLLEEITLNEVVITNKAEFEIELAILFPNEGGGSTTPNLQQVTDAGNVTSHAIEVGSELIIRNLAEGKTASIRTGNVSNDRVIAVPDKDGILVLSVNSTVPDIEGNVSITIDPTTLQQVTEAGNSTNLEIKVGNGVLIDDTALGFTAYLNVNNIGLNSNVNYNLPNKSGTVALIEDTTLQSVADNGNETTTEIKTSGGINMDYAELHFSKDYLSFVQFLAVNGLHLHMGVSGGTDLHIHGFEGAEKATFFNDGGLQLLGTSKGFIPNKVTFAQRNSIVPDVAEIVYQTNVNGISLEGLYIYKSTGWTFIV